MTNLFLKIVNMSISASWIVWAVILLRFLLQKAPKWSIVLLWGLVAIRLICPLSIESPLSLVPSPETISSRIMMDRVPEIDTGFTVLNEAVNPVITESLAPEPSASANPLQILIPVAAVIWLAGIAVLLLYTTISYFLLKRRVSTAVHLRNNVFQSEYVTTPFVLGIIRPQIYLPYSISGTDRIHVIAHERTHIRRHDHWWKPLGFLLLAIYWFNPVLWIAYWLFCRDIELACDEHVIQILRSDQRADYAQALLSCSVKPHLVSACPIAFGEIGVKTRIRSVMNYRKPGFWVILSAVAACIAVAVCFLTDPEQSAVSPASAEGKVRDFSWHLELAMPGKTCRDMDETKKADILGEYGDLLDNYTLIARESTDGSVFYIAGYFDGPIEENPLREIERRTGADFIQILRPQEDALEAPASQLPPQMPAYSLQKSCIWYGRDNPYILIEARDNEATLMVAYWRYVDPDLGGAYIQDAVSRGVSLYAAGPFLSIQTTWQKWGSVSERIALTDGDVERILAEERVFTGADKDFEASLIYGNGEKTEVFGGDLGVPPTVLDLAVKVTGYQYPIAQTAEPAGAAQEKVSDLAYFMELSVPGKEFRDMSPERKAQIIPEYGGLLDGYALIARESTDGALCYIVGYWNGPVEESPLYYLRSSSIGDENGEAQVLYDERELEAAEKYEQPEYEYVIRNSHINHSSSTGYFLIHPRDSGWGFDDVFNKYLRPNGREYMLDARSRDIALSVPEGPYLEVFLISPQWGEIYEIIPLTEEQVNRIIAEDRQQIGVGYGFVARLEPGPNSSLNLEWDSLYYTEFRGVPQTVLDLAIEKCGYTFAAPNDIRSDIVEARLECSWLEEPVYADASQLPLLQSILQNAEFGYVGACGYGAKLTIRMEDGSELILFKGTDSCDTIIFGSYGGYFLGTAQNQQFWDIFGIDISAAWS